MAPRPDPGILRAVKEQRAALRAGSVAAFEDVTAAYKQVHAQLQRDYDAFKSVWARKESEALAAGKVLDKGWVTRSNEFQNLLARYENNIAQTAPLVGARAAGTANDAITLGSQHAAELARVAGVAARAPVTAMQATVQAGPLADLITARAPVHADIVRNILTTAVGRGYAPAATAKLLTRATNGALTNAATIVRTEQMRAYRSAALETYAQNPAVNQWRWDARCGDRTCAACWSMHGEVFNTDEEMESHPNCMCVMIPVVPDVDYRDDGETLFAAADEEVQLKVLGPSAHKAYKDGAFSLRDMLKETRSADWGITRSTKSLRELLGAARAAEYIKAARAGSAVPKIAKVAKAAKAAKAPARSAAAAAVVKAYAQLPANRDNWLPNGPTAGAKSIRTVTAEAVAHEAIITRAGREVLDEVNRRVPPPAGSDAFFAAKNELRRAQDDLTNARKKGKPTMYAAERVIDARAAYKTALDALEDVGDNKKWIAARQKAIKDVLEEVRPLGGKINATTGSPNPSHPATPSPEALTTLKAAAQRYPTEWLDETSSKEIRVNVMKSGKNVGGDAFTGNPDANFIRVLDANDLSTMTHELGHIMEATTLGAGTRRDLLVAFERAFLARRGKGRKAAGNVKLDDDALLSYSVGGRKVRGVRDDFADPYTGRVYANYNGALEAFQVGVQELWDDRSGTFGADEDLLAFVLGALTVL